MSPTVFYEGPFRFYFFSREEKRMHVHVATADGEAKFWMQPDILCAERVWLIFNEKEYFLLYREFPWFKEAKVADILNVKVLHDTHLYWPSLDIDLSADILENLQKYPLVYH